MAEVIQGRNLFRFLCRKCGGQHEGKNYDVVYSLTASYRICNNLLRFLPTPSKGRIALSLHSALALLQCRSQNDFPFLLPFLVLRIECPIKQGVAVHPGYQPFQVILI